MAGSEAISDDSGTRSRSEARKRARFRFFGFARADVRAAWLYSLKVFLGLRLGLTILALAAVGLIAQNDATPVPGWPAPPVVEGIDNVGTSFERWDGLWFLRIAEDGYAENDGSAAFFPLYPTIVGGLSTLIGGHPLAAALIVSNAAFLAALVVVYLLTLVEFDHDTARRTTLYLAVWPTAFFFLAPYSESLFLLLAAGAVLCARLKRWWAAAALGALTAATRSVGIVLVAVLAAEALTQLRERRRAREEQGSIVKDAVIPLLASAAVGLGTLAYLLYWKVQSGNFFAPIGEQGNWQREFSFPLATIVDGTRAAFEFIGLGAGGYALLDWLVVIPALALAVWVAMRTRPAYGVYAWASLLLPLTLIFGARPFMSLPRFTVVIWPLFWALAHFTKQFNAHAAVVAAGAVGLGVFTMLFVNWYWIF